jgi:1-aminocyclopropane-1-carboxylate deaminase
MLFDTQKITIDEIKDPLFLAKKIRLQVLRLDKIHPVISGNKLFKLHYFLKEALLQPQKAIVTFGGAYSNHLVATAFACKNLSLPCRGIVRGEESFKLSHTLQACINFGMQLQFVPRENYAQTARQGTSYPGCYIIPEGGYHPKGAKGASLIVDLLPHEKITHICTATGTATTLAGLLLKALASQTIVSIPVLKGFTDTKERLHFLTGKDEYPNLAIWNEYHFGGYAKKTNKLIDFMNELYVQNKLPTDFVYTAKMMFAVFEQVKADFFPAGSNIVCLHTGGLQGNTSLPDKLLTF